MSVDEFAPVVEIPKPAPVAESQAKPTPSRYIAEYTDTSMQQVRILDIGEFCVGEKYEVTAREAAQLRQCVGFAITEE
jgi:hypothetical protein